MRKTAHIRGLRGFTLTEIAIVLSVIGLILGAIFAASYTARYHVELNQTTDEIGQIVSNVRALYSGQDASAAPAVALPGAILIQQGVFPVGMLVPTPPAGTIPAAGTIANHLWDQSTIQGSAQIEVNTPTVGQFVLHYVKVPYDVCTDLLVKNSVPGADTGLQQIVVNGTVKGQASNNTLPITPIAAAAACPNGAVYTIDWYYTLGS